MKAPVSPTTTNNNKSQQFEQLPSWRRRGFSRKHSGDGEVARFALLLLKPQHLSRLLREITTNNNKFLSKAVI
jgi:hypothetical protein